VKFGGDTLVQEPAIEKSAYIDITSRCKKLMLVAKIRPNPPNVG